MLDVRNWKLDLISRRSQVTIQHLTSNLQLLHCISDSHDEA